VRHRGSAKVLAKCFAKCFAKGFANGFANGFARKAAPSGSRGQFFALSRRGAIGEPFQPSRRSEPGGFCQHAG
jgi:hypothetical protein